MLTLTDAIQRYHSEQLQMFPAAKASKKPLVEWSLYKDTPISEQEQSELFTSGSPNIAILGGQVSDNLLVLDCDNRQSYSTVGQWLDSLGVVSYWQQQQSKFHPKQNHAGGGAYFVKVSQSVKSCSNLTLGCDFRSEGRYQLAPPSQHPSGSYYEWLKFGPAPLPVLDIRDIPEAKPVPIAAGYPATARDILYSGQRPKKYGGDSQYWSNSELVAALIGSLGREYSLSQILAAVEAAPVGQWLYSTTYTRDRIIRDYQRAEREILGRLTAGQQLGLQWEQWARSVAWKGRAGLTDKLVFNALLLLVRRTGKAALKASSRDIAELAGTTAKTANRSLHRIKRAGYIKLDTPGFNQWAHKWQLSSDVPKQPAESELALQRLQSRQNISVVDCSKFNAKHDIWYKLGKAALDIYSQLSDTPQTAADIIQATGRCETTVYKQLRVLTDYELAKGSAQKRNRTYTRIQASDDKLSELARELGTLGKAEHKRQQHVRERRRYRYKLAQRKRKE